jgi:hypothetical protein
MNYLMRPGAPPIGARLIPPSWSVAAIAEADRDPLALLLRSQCNERQAARRLVDDLLDGGRSFDGHGRAGTQHPRRKRRCRRNGLTPSSSTQPRAASAPARAADILATPAARDLERVV